MKDLQTLVDELTLPQPVSVRQDIYEGDRVIGSQTFTTTVEPLLAQLDAAIRSDLGSTARGASLAFERSILDGDALYKFIQISTQIGDWCRMVGAKVTRRPVTDLRAWFEVAHDVPVWYTEKLWEWAGFIRSKLDRKPRELELPDACPACEATTWGEVFAHPLVVRYRPDAVSSARGACRACDASWPAGVLADILQGITTM